MFITIFCFLFYGVKATLMCGDVTVPGEIGEYLSRTRILSDAVLSMTFNIISCARFVNKSSGLSLTSLW